MMCRTTRAWLFLTVAAALAWADPSPQITAEQKEGLERAFAGWLVDPSGKKYVQVRRVVHSAWGSSAEVQVHGWLAALGAPGEARVFFLDGDSMPAPPEHEEVDFVAQSLAVVEAAEKADAAARARSQDELPELQAIVDRMLRVDVAVGEGPPPAVRAAWLWRLGQEALAARVLHLAGGIPRLPAPDAAPEKEGLARELAWRAYSGAVHAYMVGADPEAIEHAERLFRLYPGYAETFGDGKALLADLQRRRDAGTLGRTGEAEAPKGLAEWPVEKRIATLIEALDQVNARQWSQPGGVTLGSDWRVRALAEIGDPAVPALLDCLEKDRRLTRSVHFWRDFHQSRTVLAVREAALTALTAILRIKVFTPDCTGDNFTSHGASDTQTVAQNLRAYWERYGGLPFDRRMMKVLTDPANTGEMALEAARNLAAFGRGDRGLGSLWGENWIVVREDREVSPSPVVGTFSGPTVAEAALDALGRQLAADDAAASRSGASSGTKVLPPTDPQLLERHNDDAATRAYRRLLVERAYAGVLSDLGDRRIAPKLAARASCATTLGGRITWAVAAHSLGEAAPLATLAGEVRAGRLAPTAGGDDLRSVVGALEAAHLPEAEAALFALAEPANPWYEAVRARVLERASGSEDVVFFSHPFCLAVLRRALDDESATGERYVVRPGDRLRREMNGGWSEAALPAVVSDPARRRKQVSIRRCDDAAERLSGLIFGSMPYHLLLRGAEERRARLCEVFDRFSGRWRRPSRLEQRVLDPDSSWFDRVPFLPGIEPLGRPATEEDVAAGRALFHFEGQGRVASLALPASAWRKEDLAGKADRAKTPRVLVVQAEEAPDGRLRLGILGRSGFGVVEADETEDLQPLVGEPPKKAR